MSKGLNHHVFDDDDDNDDEVIIKITHHDRWWPAQVWSSGGADEVEADSGVRVPVLPGIGRCGGPSQLQPRSSLLSSSAPGAHRPVTSALSTKIQI